MQVRNDECGGSDVVVGREVNMSILVVAGPLPPRGDGGGKRRKNDRMTLIFRAIKLRSPEAKETK